MSIAYHSYNPNQSVTIKTPNLLHRHTDVVKRFRQLESSSFCEKYNNYDHSSILSSLQFFGYVEEAEWAIETMKESNKPVACTMRIGPMGDYKGVSPQDCAVRMARAGNDPKL